MNMPNWRERLVLERQFRNAIIEAAEWQGWLCYHVVNVKGQLRNETSEGFPDLVMARANRINFAELKTERGVLTRKQKRWLDELRMAETDQVGVHLWKPKDWDDIMEVLR